MTDESLLYEHAMSRPLLVMVGFKKLILNNNKKPNSLHQDDNFSYRV